jgi:hypothetical protein
MSFYLARVRPAPARWRGWGLVLMPGMLVPVMKAGTLSYPQKARSPNAISRLTVSDFGRRLLSPTKFRHRAALCAVVAGRCVDLRFWSPGAGSGLTDAAEHAGSLDCVCTLPGRPLR